VPDISVRHLHFLDERRDRFRPVIGDARAGAAGEFERLDRPAAAHVRRAGTTIKLARDGADKRSAEQRGSCVARIESPAARDVDVRANDISEGRQHPVEVLIQFGYRVLALLQ
jgi:hypothetical protein